MAKHEVVLTLGWFYESEPDLCFFLKWLSFRPSKQRLSHSSNEQDFGATTKSYNQPGSFSS